MPELPEVETTRRGLSPHVLGQRIVGVTVRERRFRWPIPARFAATLRGKTIQSLSRRGKYLLWACGESANGTPSGHVLSHLGMSGSLQVVNAGTPLVAHDHLDIALENDALVRFNDPRRFGAMLWIAGVSPTHPLLETLGPEPLSSDFHGRHLYAVSRGRRVSVKEFIMNGRIVVGVGNIYASESLFDAQIDPRIEAGRVSLTRFERLAASIKTILAQAIEAGGSSLRDYVQADGALGYFQHQTRVYDREGAACTRCMPHPTRTARIRSITQGQRSTYFCARCQR